MSQIIKIKRGNEADLENTTLQEGELATTIDTKKLYMGTSDGQKIEIGAQGDKGPEGLAGQRGTKWYVGDFYSETIEDANNGDVYLNTGTQENGTVFRFQDGTWNPMINLVGPVGQSTATGGNSGDLLMKASDNNYDTTWYQIVPPIYKRRIMVGDNLRNIDIFMEQIPEDLKGALNKDLGEDGTHAFPIMCNEGVTGYIESFITRENNLPPTGLEINCYDLMGEDPYCIYEDQSNIITINAPFHTVDDRDYNVFDVSTTPDYRCFFIEDSNIRPVKVGDEIISGTKMYFIFPDDLPEQIEKTIGEITETNEYSVDIFTLPEVGEQYGYLNLGLYNYGEKEFNIIFEYPGSTSSQETITGIYYTGGEKDISTNKSVFTFSESVGTIDQVNVEYGQHLAVDWTKYVLVDVRTLGNHSKE